MSHRPNRRERIGDRQAFTGESELNTGRDGEVPANADGDGDGEVDIMDLVWIIDVIVGG